MRRYDFYNLLGYLIAALIIACYIYFQNQENASKDPVNSGGHILKDRSGKDSVLNNGEVIDFEHPMRASNIKFMKSLIDSADITFDNNFEPIATIKLYNNTKTQIDQVVFKFAFEKPDQQDGTMSIAANECASYYDANVYVKPGEYTKGLIKVPAPKRKVFDSPDITIIKVRFSNGNIISLDQ